MHQVLAPARSLAASVACPSLRIQHCRARLRPRKCLAQARQTLPGDGQGGGSPPNGPIKLSTDGDEYSRRSFLRFFILFFTTTLFVAFVYKVVMFIKHGRGGGDDKGQGGDEGGDGKGGNKGEDGESKKKESATDKVKKAIPFASIGFASIFDSRAAPDSADNTASAAQSPSAPTATASEDDTSALVHLGGPDDGASDDIETMRRLLRDLFEQQMLLENRVRVVEAAKQFRGERGAPVDRVATGAIAPRARYIAAMHNLGNARVTHVLDGIAGATAHQGTLDYSRAGLHTGPRLLSCAKIEKAFGGGEVTLRTVASGSGLRVWQAQLRRNLGRRVEVVLSPASARFADIATPLHACAGALSTYNDFVVRHSASF